MKDSLCSYYTNSKDITSYMVARLGISDNDTILEPSAGEGIFIDEILEINKNVHIDALDINGEAVAILKKKYMDIDAVTIRETDTLFDEQLDFVGLSGQYYSKVIGNPPYGAWQNYEKRNLLKKKYSGHYVKETYSLFLLRCISVLKMGGKLSFIIPDTYLFLNMHSRLRKTVLANTRIDEILIFPSKFFPGVSFGYSNLSIITLERCEESAALNNTFRVIKGFKTSREFSGLIDENCKLLTNLQIYELKQGEVLQNNQSRVILTVPETNIIFNRCTTTLGDVADVVTGFYTGDNSRFIKVLNKSVKGARNYEEVRQEQIFECTSLYGIPNVEEGYIPYIKSVSKRRYLRQADEWFVRWDRNAIKLYNGNKRSRFQNSSFYFKTGIGIPMVKSSTIKAFLMTDHVFDQSIVGIFPKENNKLLYFLALMNSDVINELVHAINPTANNSANYIKQIPYFEPDEEEMAEITGYVSELISCDQSCDYDGADALHQKLNAMIEKLYANVKSSAG